MRVWLWLLLSAVGAGGIPGRGLAAEYFLDPVHGSLAGDGSAGDPWPGLQAVVEAGMIETRRTAVYPYVDGGGFQTVNAGAPIQPGDTLWLRSGYHGELSLQGAYNSAMITIAAAPGETPLLRRAFLRAASRWTLRGLSISVSHAPQYAKTTLVDIDNHSWHGPSSEIVVEDCELFSVPDITSWSAEDWVNLAANGINVDGADCRIVGNRIRNIRFGISTGGDRVLVAGNRITNISGDGMRGLGDDSVFEYNLVENCYDVDENHDDGFQSWSSGEGGVGTGEVRGLVLRGNIFINHRDPNQPLRGTFQGIGCFDGMFVDWVVENNLVCVDHWHGITLMGAKNCRIVNNTVIDMFSGSPGPSWIRITAHKNGTAASGNLIANNLANSFSIDADAGTRVANLTVSDPAAVFVDPEHFDFRLRAGSPAIGGADPAFAPVLDAVGRTRGAAPSLGALESVAAWPPAFSLTAKDGAAELSWREWGYGNGYRFAVLTSADLQAWSEDSGTIRAGADRRLLIPAGPSRFFTLALRPE